MTRNEIIEMAKQAQLPHDHETGEPMLLNKLEIFARLVQEREHMKCISVVSREMGQYKRRASVF